MRNSQFNTYTDHVSRPILHQTGQDFTFSEMPWPLPAAGYMARSNPVLLRLVNGLNSRKIIGSADD